jgi:hypothetical protein
MMPRSVDGSAAETLPTPAILQTSCPAISPSMYWFPESPFWRMRRSPPVQLVTLIHAAAVIALVGSSCGASGTVTMPVLPSKLSALLAIRPGTHVTVPDVVPWSALMEKSVTALPEPSSNS